MADLKFDKYLPPYRLLLTPNAHYDYKTHSLVQLSQQELLNIVQGFQAQQKIASSTFKMKYKSLLTDALRKALLLLMRVLGSSRQGGAINNTATAAAKNSSNTLSAAQRAWKTVRAFDQLPSEIQLLVFSYVDDAAAYRNCLVTCPHFYRLAKPFVYRAVAFELTYRFAQFVTCLRLNPALGELVLSVNISGLKPANWQLEDADNSLVPEDAPVDLSRVQAGWRDWKFRNNPLYLLHPAPPIPLTKQDSNVAKPPGPAGKRTKLSKYFKKRRPSQPHTEIHSQAVAVHQQNRLRRAMSSVATQSTHPSMNKFLLNYQAQKDLPVGYILHLVMLCPNLEHLNMKNVSLSTDYRIAAHIAHKYQLYDIMHNYHRDLIKVIDHISPITPRNVARHAVRVQQKSDKCSTHSLVLSLSFHEPLIKYNSLLPPSTTEILYLTKGDGKVFLSDINVKAINEAHLEIVHESDIMRYMAKRSTKLRYLDMSSMVWMNVRLVKHFLAEFLADNLVETLIDGKDYLLFKGRHFEAVDLVKPDPHSRYDDSLVVVLNDLGMYKNLPWAQTIDLATRTGNRLVHHILNEELLNPFEEYIVRERIRRGRIGENYFS